MALISCEMDGNCSLRAQHGAVLAHMRAGTGRTRAERNPTANDTCNATADNTCNASVEMRQGAGVERNTDMLRTCAKAEWVVGHGVCAQSNRGPSGIPTADDAHGAASVEVRGHGGAGTQDMECEDGDGCVRCLRTHPHGYAVDVGERNPTADNACDVASVEGTGMDVGFVEMVVYGVEVVAQDVLVLCVREHEQEQRSQRERRLCSRIQTNLACGSAQFHRRGVDGGEGGSSKHILRLSGLRLSLKSIRPEHCTRYRGRRPPEARRRRWSDLQERAAGDTALQAQFELDLYTKDQPEGGQEGTNGDERRRERRSTAPPNLVIRVIDISDAATHEPLSHRLYQWSSSVLWSCETFIYPIPLCLFQLDAKLSIRADVEPENPDCIENVRTTSYSSAAPRNNQLSHAATAPPAHETELEFCNQLTTHLRTIRSTPSNRMDGIEHEGIGGKGQGI
ncbi:hypothetical protein C8R45DRAFT_929224 [Mycena sanguinolenta]|nr:hypothetical protein C8R45DRAFT_929224 [Mycena sanguinolenta]